MNIISRIEKLERRFERRKYDGKGTREFVIEKGTVPVMISAPHTVNHFREGAYKCAEMYIGGITRYLGSVLGCHLIYSTNCKSSDPNYDSVEQSKYKKELQKYIQDNDIRILIDLHGCKAERETAIDFGTINDYDGSLHEYRFIVDLFQMVMGNYLRDFLTDSKTYIGKNVYFSAENPNTITNYISRTIGIPCIQVEINKLCRNPQECKVFTQLVDGLAEVITYLTNADWNAKRILVFRAEKSEEHFPQNKIEINSSFGFRALDCLFAKGIADDTEIVQIKSNEDIKPDEILLTNRLIECFFKDRSYINQPVLVFQYEDKRYGIGRPAAEIREVTVTEGMFEELKSKQDKYTYMLYNRYTGTKMHLKLVSYGKRSIEKVFLPYYYRELLGVEMPIEKMTALGFEEMKNDLQSQENEQILNEAYKEVEFGENGKCYELQDDGWESVKKINFKPGIEIICKPRSKTKFNFGRYVKNIRDCIMSVLIGYTEIHMRVCRPRITDDKNKVARMSGDMMNLLGVSENDKITVLFGDKEEQLRVMAVEKEDDMYGKKDMLIGIPVETRTHLAISINDIVCVKRDMWYTFKRNTNQQLFSIFGTVLTIVTLSDAVWMRVLLCIVAIPFVIYVSFAEERVKVEKK